MSRVDFLRPRPLPRVGWVLLALGAAALATALWFDRRWAAERAGIERAQQQALELQRALRSPPPPVVPTLEQLRWQQAQSELRLPWRPALRAIESATVNPVFLLSLTIEPSKGLLKLDAEAPSFDHALAYVQVLDEGGVLQPAALVSHETTTNAQGGPGLVKFSAVTHWSVPGLRP